jgi:zinc and cadmium transporter
MSTFILILGAVILVSLISLVGIITLALKETRLKKIIFFLVSFAAGSLLGAAFLDLIPEAIEGELNSAIFIYILGGIILFFLLEKFLYWTHCHEGVCDVHTFSYLNLFGDGMHNFIDGAIIATGFLSSTPLGLITTLAIIFHEIPQELGDFSVLVYGGFSRKKALFYNYLCSLTAILGALVGYFFNSLFANLNSLMLAFAAGGFIYIACVDLIPELHKERNLKTSLLQIILIVLGISLIWMVKLLFS